MSQRSTRSRPHIREARYSYADPPRQINLHTWRDQLERIDLSSKGMENDLFVVL